MSLPFHSWDLGESYTPNTFFFFKNVSLPVDDLFLFVCCLFVIWIGLKFEPPRDLGIICNRHSCAYYQKKQEEEEEEEFWVIGQEMFLNEYVSDR